MSNEATDLKISVVVPVRNEAESIGPQLDELFDVLDSRVDFEVVYVDDSSTDDTLKRLMQERDRRGDRLRILHHSTGCGQSTALYSGIRAARHPWIVTLDGDGQNDPADIPRLLDELSRAGDSRLLITGHRVKRRDTWLRRASSRIANAIRGALLKDQTPDTGCGLKAFSRSLFLELPYFDHMHRFLSALVLRHGGRIQSIPVSHRPRERGTSKYGLHDRLWVGIVDLFGVAWLQRREKRPSQVSEITGGPPGGQSSSPGTP